MLKVICIVTGGLNENCYIIHNSESALIIDPGDEADKIIQTIEQNNLNVLGILITHYHFDHIGALEEIKNKYSYARVLDYNDVEDIKLGEFSFKVISTPGHTIDSVSFYFDSEDILFSGDFVFKGTIGKFDKENALSMRKSLNVLKFMSKEAIIYPGHGENTTVLNELKNNPYVKGI